MLAWYAPLLSCAIKQQNKDKIMKFKYRHGRVKAKAKGIVFYFAAYTNCSKLQIKLDTTSYPEGLTFRLL